VILDKLTPAERLAFVLHDMFAVPFDEIASILGRSPTATRQLASRAAACREPPRFPMPNFPSSEVWSTPSSLPCAPVTSKAFSRYSTQMSWCEWTKLRRVGVRRGRSVGRGTGPRGHSHSRRLPDSCNRRSSTGRWDSVWAPRGRLYRVLSFTITCGKIAEIDVIADPLRLRTLDLAVLNHWR